MRYTTTPDRDAENLTMDQLVRAHPTERIEALAGHVIVVFERRGPGEEFRFELREGQRAPSRPLGLSTFFGEKPQYSAFAVTAESQRRTRFCTEVPMDVQLHSFTLHVDLVYSIADPRLLVTMRNQDPLRTLHEEAASLIRPHFQRAEWNRVRRDFRGLEREVVAEVFARLQRFARDYGILVQEISLSHRLSEKDFQDIAKIEAAQHVALDDELGHARDTRREELERIRESNRTTSVIESHEVHTTIEAFARRRDIADATARAAIKAIESAASSIHSPAELAQAVATIRESVEAIHRLGDGNGQGQAQTGTSTRPPARLAAAPQSGAGAVIAELFEDTEQMNWPALPVKQKLQAATLHLIAELLLPDATDVSITDYRERLSDARAAAALPFEQSNYFGKYIDSDNLRRRLT